MFKDRDACPACGSPPGDAIQIDDGPSLSSSPKPGDYGLCFSCGTILVYDNDLTTRVINDDELQSMNLENQKTIEKAQRLIRGLKQ